MAKKIQNSKTKKPQKKDLLKTIGLRRVPTSVFKEAETLLDKDNKFEVTKEMGILDKLKNARARGRKFDQLRDSISTSKPIRRKRITQRKAVGGSIIKGAASGALAGSTFGPIGAGVGAVIGGATDLLNAKALKEEEDKAKREKNQAELAVAGANIGLKNGGKVEGKGTSKSDSIETELDAGDFIIPAENADRAMEIGQEHLGWNPGQVASLKDGEEPVNLSDGEVRFTKEEKAFLDDIGIPVEKLAPKAKETPNEIKETEEQIPGNEDAEIVDEVIVKDNEPQNKSKGGAILKKTGKFIKNNPGTTIGAAQLGLGLIESIGASKDKDAIPELKSQSAVANQSAANIKSSAKRAADAILSQTDKSASDAMGEFMKTAKESGGANSAAVLSNAAKVSDRSGNIKLAGRSKVAEVLANAESQAASIKATGAQSDLITDRENIARKERRASERSEAANALIGAGASNIAGEAALKDFDKRIATIEEEGVLSNTIARRRNKKLIKDSAIKKNPNLNLNLKRRSISDILKTS